MNIAVLVPFFNNKVSGFEEFIVETISHFVDQHPGERFFILTEPGVSDGPVLPANSTVIITKSSNNALLQKIWWRIKLPSILKKLKADLCISFDEGCSLTSVIPQIIFCREPGKLKPLFIKKARSVFVASQAVKEQLITLSRTPAEKIFIIQPAPAKYFLVADIATKEEIKKEYSEGREFFLFNSSFQKQADIIDLLKSFSHFKKRQQSSFQLLIFADPDSFFEKTLSAYKYRDDVKFLGAKDKNSSSAITAAAYAVVLPFNANEDMMAALNAMRSGVPVIATRNSVVNEIAGDAASYAEKETKDIGERMIQLYTNEEFRFGLIEKGKDRVKEFTHGKAAASLWQFMMRACKMN